MTARRPSSGPVRWIIIATGLALAPGLLGCSPSASDSEAKASRDRQMPDFIGEHFYACPDGSRLDVDFLGDGLTLAIKTNPNAAPMRVTSPASGLTYVGPNLNVSISGGDLITLEPLMPYSPAGYPFYTREFYELEDFGDLIELERFKKLEADRKAG